MPPRKRKPKSGKGAKPRGSSPAKRPAPNHRRLSARAIAEAAGAAIAITGGVASAVALRRNAAVIRDLRDQINQLAQPVMADHDVMHEVGADLEECTGQLATCQQAVDAFERTMGELAQTNTILQQQLADKEQELVAMAAHVDDSVTVVDELDRTRAELRTASHEVDRLETLAQQQHTQIAHLETAIATFERAAADRNDRARRFRMEADEAKAERDRTNHEISQLNDTHSELEADIRRLRLQKAALEKEIDALMEDPHLY